jgi:hypothetical protein
MVNHKKQKNPKTQNPKPKKFCFKILIDGFFKNFKNNLIFINFHRIDC